jgi:hypothetical protein
MKVRQEPENFMAVKVQLMVFWVMTPCRLVGHCDRQTSVYFFDINIPVSFSKRIQMNEEVSRNSAIITGPISIF